MFIKFVSKSIWWCTLNLLYILSSKYKFPSNLLISNILLSNLTMYSSDIYFLLSKKSNNSTDVLLSNFLRFRSLISLSALKVRIIISNKLLYCFIGRPLNPFLNSFSIKAVDISPSTNLGFK